MVNSRIRVRGGGGCGAGVTTPRPRPRPRIKTTGFPRTRTQTQLIRLFPVKIGAGAGGTRRVRVVLPCLLRCYNLNSNHARFFKVLKRMDHRNLKCWHIVKLTMMGKKKRMTKCKKLERKRKYCVIFFKMWIYKNEKSV